MPAIEHKTKLQLQTNIATDCTFVFGEPIQGESQYGPYDLWTIVVDGERQSLFARNSLAKAIQEAAPAAGEMLRITKTEKESGKGFDYTVERPSNGTAEQPKPDPTDWEAERVGAYVHRYVAICTELSRQWPDLHEKDSELFKSAASTIYIAMDRGSGH